MVGTGRRIGLLCCAIVAAVSTGAVLWVLRTGGGRREAPLPEAERSGDPKLFRVIASERTVRPQADSTPHPDVSAAVAVVCGKVEASAGLYGIRNEALRSIARRRDLAEGDVVELMAYVASGSGSLSPVREAALRNDVLNLLRDQEPLPGSLPDLLMGIVWDGRYDATLVDYAIQHLGALRHDLGEGELARRVGATLVHAASGIGRPYAGTALYALADSHGMAAAESGCLRRLTCAACSPQAHPLVRLSAFQLAGQRGYREVLPDVRAVLRGDCRDAVADTVAVGTLGLLGDASDAVLIEEFSARGGSRLSEPCAAAIGRINGRIGK